MFADTRIGNSSFLPPHDYPGRLITAEGLDGSGKSTQLQLLSFWLNVEGYEVVTIEWTASSLIKRALKKGKKQGQKARSREVLHGHPPTLPISTRQAQKHKQIHHHT